MFEEIIVPCWGRKFEEEVMPALRTAFFKKELEPLGDLVRRTKAADTRVQEAIEQDYQAIRHHILHGQIDYTGEGPLPEHWKQFIDRETNYYDWRHPKWAMDAERFVVDMAVRAAAVEGWDPRVRAEARTTDGVVNLLLEVKEKSMAAAPLIDKFLEGMPEWLQHNNAFTGGYLTEDEVVRMLEIFKQERAALEGSLSTKALLAGWMDKLERAAQAKVGLSWTVV
jgi:hypothetical protein